MRQHAAEIRATESEQDRADSLQQMRQHAVEIRAKESEQDREARLQQVSQHAAEIRDTESEQDRAYRLQKMRQHAVEIRATESEQDRETRLQQVSQHAAEIRAIESEQDKEPRLQQMSQHAAEIRATESEQDRAYRLQQMRQRNAESRRLSRASITGFMQAINTFCDKICEVYTKRCYQYQISRWIVDTKTALYLPNELKQRNCLVVCNRCTTHLSSKKNIAPSKSYWNNLDPGSIPENVAINEENIIRIEKASVEIAVETNEEPTGDASACMEISDSSRIIRASWHQGNDLIFTSGFSGVQCCAMTLANILRASILSPQYWSTNILNLNMLTGDQIYSNIRFQMARNLAAYSIENDQYLLVRNFKVIKDDLATFGKRFRITFDEEPSIYGSLNDKLNEANLGSTLRQGLEDLFMGSSANDNHGKACVIECDTFDEFVRICKRTTGSKNVQFTLDYVDVEVFEMHDDSKET
ncbi:uncharacterized protein CDAR_584331 [Caerostris darwini]|uniref:STPR domain-containing protein n=1 Tax=Caerostris darwini TaxID=1538125 RepID=A0AAV4U4F9_9ARAC|nr:uncharacterized protein CDAR_584331 [Caerostris darwini]